jgi:hypothetical protein
MLKFSRGEKMANVIDSTYNTQVANAKNYANSAKTSAKSQIDSAQSADLAAIEKNYNDAVANGDMSIKDAKIKYDQDVQALNKQYYNESKNANLYSESMGIQDTNQALGVMAATSERQASNVNQRAIQRQNTIDDIKQQLSKLRSDADLNITQTKSRYGSELRGQYAQIDMNLSNQIGQYASDRGNKYFQQSERIAGQQFTASESQKQRDFQAEQDRQNRDAQAKLADKQNAYHTQNDMMAYVRGHFNYDEKTKKWVSLDGKKTYNNPEQAYYSTAPASSSMSDKDQAQYTKKLESYTVDANKNPIMNPQVVAAGDFSGIDPRNKKYNYNMWDSWTADPFNPMGGYDQRLKTDVKKDTKTFNSQAEAYAKYYNAMIPEDRAKVNAPPAMIKYDYKTNKYVEYKWYDPSKNQWSTTKPKN